MVLLLVDPPTLPGTQTLKTQPCHSLDVLEYASWETLNPMGTRTGPGTRLRRGDGPSYSVGDGPGKCPPPVGQTDTGSTETPGPPDGRPVLISPLRTLIVPTRFTYTHISFPTLSVPRPSGRAGSIRDPCNGVDVRTHSIGTQP